MTSLEQTQDKFNLQTSNLKTEKREQPSHRDDRLEVIPNIASKKQLLHTRYKSPHQSVIVRRYPHYTSVPTSPEGTSRMVKDNTEGTDSVEEDGSISSGVGSIDTGGGGFCQLNNSRGMRDRVYWEKRRKNNESAKRSRDARRMKEEQIALRVVYLEQENLQLSTEVALLQNEIEKLRCMLYRPGLSA